MSDTFGCGQILPGFGPGNSSDSPLGGGGDIPNDDDWTDWDKFDGEKDDGGPPGPPLEEDWQCRIVEAGTEGSVPCFDPWKEDCYEWTYTQDCIDIILVLLPLVGMVVVDPLFLEVVLVLLAPQDQLPLAPIQIVLV